MNTILLLDYDPRSIGRIRGALSARGCHVEVCRSGREALEAVRRVRPTLTLIHDLLPGRHGFEVCREIKQSEEGRSGAVALLVGARPGRVRDLPDTGCDGWLLKPFGDEALLELVGRWIDVEPPRRFSAVPHETAAARDSLLERRVHRTKVEVPVELTETDIMGRLDAILPGVGGPATAAGPKSDPPAATPGRACGGARRAKRPGGNRAEARKTAKPRKKKAKRKTSVKRRPRSATTAAAS